MRKIVVFLAIFFLVGLTGNILPTAASVEKSNIEFRIPNEPKAEGAIIKIVVLKINGQLNTGFNETVKLYVAKVSLEDSSSCNPAPFDVTIENGQGEFRVWGKNGHSSSITLRIESSLGTFSRTFDVR